MIPYIGGKFAMSKLIISQFPEDYRKRTYVEVFGGGGWVLFKKDPSNIEVYNDLNSTLVTIFRTIRDDYEKFRHLSEWSLHSRELFEEALRKIRSDQFDCDLEKALAKAITQIQSFSGEGKSWAYEVQSPNKRISGSWLPFLRRLSLINARLKRVQIENLDFERLIQKYDRPTTLFYVDPPYVNTEQYYNSKNVHFTKDDHYRLAKVLHSIKGKFVLSYYEHPLVRNLYPNNRIIAKDNIKSSVVIRNDKNTKSRPKSRELLIFNY